MREKYDPSGFFWVILKSDPNCDLTPFGNLTPEFLRYFGPSGLTLQIDEH